MTLALALLAGLLMPLAGQAQSASPVPDALARADRLYRSGRPLESLETAELFLRERPRSFEALWRASRAAVSLGLLEETKAAQNRWYMRGADYGRRAADVRADRVEGHYWLAANAGLHALQESRPGRVADLGEEVHRAATTVLELEPAHAGAHNVLGRLQMAIMELSSLERMIGRHLLGSEAISFASWEGARRHLSRAVELDPDFILYRLDLGRLHLRRQRPRAAARELRAALRLEPVHPPDARFRDRARELLRRIGSEAPVGAHGAIPETGTGEPHPPARPSPGSG